ncbi:helix-turn-helix domain-containing protein [Paenibacillus sp. FSL P4-0184]|uniref:helix-turn-helix domain-containing protein n=1 Tax=Paenibacillus sp. FSL P4-0184 TaxID=2921632 RepID=UPI0030F9C1BC
MLSDTARKLLMIMRHCSVHHGYMPTLEVLERKSGRTSGKIRAGLQELTENNYILWEFGKPLESAVVVEGWERPDSRLERSEENSPIQWGVDGSNTDYWTMY